MVLLNYNILGKFGGVSSTHGPPVVPPRITPSPVSNKFHLISYRYLLKFKSYFHFRIRMLKLMG